MFKTNKGKQPGFYQHIPVRCYPMRPSCHMYLPRYAAACEPVPLRGGLRCACAWRRPRRDDRATTGSADSTHSHVAASNYLRKSGRESLLQEAMSQSGQCLAPSIWRRQKQSLKEMHARRNIRFEDWCGIEIKVKWYTVGYLTIIMNLALKNLLK